MAKKEAKTVEVTERLLEQLLAEKYPLPEWVLLPQVSSGTGGAHQRTTDAIALNCYPSRGMELHGFEIKVTKYDWLRELREPDKSVPVQKFCDRWWLVISKSGFVEPGTLPPTWGMMEVEVKKGNTLGLRVVTPAPKLEPQTLNRTFVASVLRNAAAVVTPQSALKEARDAGIKEGHAAAGKSCEYITERLQQQLDQERATIHKFQETSGVNLSHYQAGDIGHAVRAVLNYGNPVSVLCRQRDTLVRLVQGLDLALEQMKETAT